jgi:hypothetical protein
MYKSKLCKASVPNTSDKSKFSHFELITVREYSDQMGGTYLDEINTATDYLDHNNSIDEPFYRIFAVHRRSSPKKYQFIIDFLEIKDAINFLEDLTGENIDIRFY